MSFSFSFSLCLLDLLPAGVTGRALDGVAGRDDDPREGAFAVEAADLRSRVEVAVDLVSFDVPAVDPDRCCRVPVAVRRVVGRVAEGNGCEVLV